MLGRLAICSVSIFVLIEPTLAQSERPSDRPFAAFDRASEPIFGDPHDVVLGPDNRLYVADKLANRIAILDRDTLQLVGSFGEGELVGPRDVDFDDEGRALVADSGNGRVAIYAFPSGRAQLVGSIAGVIRTEGAAAHPNGRIYATSSGLGTIIAFKDGQPVAAAGGLIGAHDIAVDPNGDLWVADMGNRRIVKYSPDLEVLTTLDGPEYGWRGPRYLDVDVVGRLVVADQDAHRIVMIDVDGNVVGVLGDGVPGIGPNKFDDPEGVEIDGSTYFFADSDNNRIVRYQLVTN